MKLIRVRYGRKDTPVELREYQEEGIGPVGTILEFEKVYPLENFEVIDNEKRKS